MDSIRVPMQQSSMIMMISDLQTVSFHLQVLKATEMHESTVAREVSG